MHGWAVAYRGGARHLHLQLLPPPRPVLATPLDGHELMVVDSWLCMSGRELMIVDRWLCMSGRELMIVDRWLCMSGNELMAVEWGKSLAWQTQGKPASPCSQQVGHPASSFPRCAHNRPGYPAWELQ